MPLSFSLWMDVVIYLPGLCLMSAATKILYCACAECFGALVVILLRLAIPDGHHFGTTGNKLVRPYCFGVKEEIVGLTRVPELWVVTILLEAS